MRAGRKCHATANTLPSDAVSISHLSILYLTYPYPYPNSEQRKTGVSNPSSDVGVRIGAQRPMDVALGEDVGRVFGHGYHKERTTLFSRNTSTLKIVSISQTKGGYLVHALQKGTTLDKEDSHVETDC